MFDPVISDLNAYLAQDEMLQCIEQEAAHYLSEECDYYLDTEHDADYTTGLSREVSILYRNIELAYAQSDRLDEALAEAKIKAHSKLCELLYSGKIGGGY